jgi:hypothetical protein
MAAHIHITSLINSLLRWTVVVLLLYAATTHEDEENKIQNHLETLWLKIVYTKDAALSTSVRFTSSIATLTGRVFDWAFGHRLLSLRSVNASFCFSIASVLALGVIEAHVLHVISAPEVSLSVLGFAAGFVILGCLPALKWPGTIIVLSVWAFLLYRIIPESCFFFST